MKPFLLLCGLLWVTISPASAQTFGFYAGLNYQQLSDVSLNNLNTQFRSEDGWHLGAWFEFELGPIAVRHGLRYMDAGQLFTGINDRFPATPDNFDVSLLEASLLFRYGIQAPVIGPYVFAGPVLRLPAFTDKEISNDLAPISAAAEAGAGLEITISNLRLYPEIAYAFGISNFIGDSIVINFAELTPASSQQLNSALIRLSVAF